MKPLYFFVLVSFCMGSSTFAASPELLNPLRKWSNVWLADKYKAANTAATANYLTAYEKEFVWLLNLARMYPKAFAETVLKSYPDSSDQPQLRKSGYYKSLLSEMLTQTPVAGLLPDSLCWVSAACHAESSGRLNYVGHDRKTAACKKLMHLRAECCHYGQSDPLEALLSLLIDENVPSLGHRRAIFSTRYSLVGVSFKPHKTYGTNVVADFY